MLMRSCFREWWNDSSSKICSRSSGNRRLYLLISASFICAERTTIIPYLQGIMILPRPEMNSGHKNFFSADLAGCRGPSFPHDAHGEERRSCNEEQPAADPAIA